MLCHSVSCGEGGACSNTNIWFLTKNTCNESAALCNFYLPCQNLLYFDELSVTFLRAECWVDCLWQSEFIVINISAYRIRSEHVRLGFWHSLFGSVGSGNFPEVVSALGIDHTAVPLLISSHKFRKKPFSPPVHYKYETVPCIFMLWTTTHNFPSEHVLQPENQRNPKNIRTLIHNQVIKLRSVTVTRSGYLIAGPVICLRICWTCLAKFTILCVLWTVHRDTHTWETPTSCTLSNLYHLICPRNVSIK